MQVALYMYYLQTCNAAAKRGQAGTDAEANTHPCGGGDAGQEQIQDGESGSGNEGEDHDFLGVGLLGGDSEGSNGDNGTFQDVLQDAHSKFFTVNSKTHNCVYIL